MLFQRRKIYVVYTLEKMAFYTGRQKYKIKGQ